MSLHNGISATDAASFQDRLLTWFDRHGRHDLPWQGHADSYPIWISEIMLQQTQVSTVIPYYKRFMARFPDLAMLARADIDEVLAHWAGLGYYSRARNLHRCAGLASERYGGALPDDIDALTELPGIGRSTAGAILAFAHGQRHPILDGNVRRILCRHFAVEGWSGDPKVQARLWAIADALTPDDRVGDYTQAVMDLGATLCRRGKPDCGRCPLADTCQALAQERVAELPFPKPRRENPVRETAMYLCEIEGQGVLVERRPPSGIWGGLWSLPERPVAGDFDAETAAWFHDTLDLQVEAWRGLPVLRHKFTHFTLDIHPYHLRVRRTSDRIMEADGVLWYTRPTQEGIGRGEEVAVPTPVRRLLDLIENDRGLLELWNKVENE
ncbi:MAG: A/G-specific adenine glycosylase [Gammaproteobacteria bacterium]|nr:A/G-specific adenine glycosylase [Gammaproteobacteria bacterium]